MLLNFDLTMPSYGLFPPGFPLWGEEKVGIRAFFFRALFSSRFRALFLLRARERESAKKPGAYLWFSSNVIGETVPLNQYLAPNHLTDHKKCQFWNSWRQDHGSQYKGKESGL